MLVLCCRRTKIQCQILNCGVVNCPAVLLFFDFMDLSCFAISWALKDRNTQQTDLSRFEAKNLPVLWRSRETVQGCWMWAVLSNEFFSPLIFLTGVERCGSPRSDGGSQRNPAEERAHPVHGVPGLPAAPWRRCLQSQQGPDLQTAAAGGQRHLQRRPGHRLGRRCPAAGRGRRAGLRPQQLRCELEPCCKKASGALLFVHLVC